ncbi:MAG: polyprenyl diphosphate synthase [Prevotella sp.]
MKNQLDMSRIPRHIAIIMDGNGRWAEARGKERKLGHQAGVETVRCITAECARLGVKYLTLYTFSMENWNRPTSEVQELMGLVLSSLKDDIFMKFNVRFRVIGEINRLSMEIQDRLKETMETTASNDGMTMVVALSYSSRWEITKAMRNIIGELQKKSLGKYSEEELDQLITEDVVSRHLETSFMPDPDLLIRTGGELRVSNYLLWQIAYTELYFCDTYWPDFREQNLYKAILSYQKRQRRFGKTEAQIEDTKNGRQTDDGEEVSDPSGEITTEGESFEEVE